MVKLSKAGKRERKLARRGVVRAMPAIGVTTADKLATVGHVTIAPRVIEVLDRDEYNRKQAGYRHAPKALELRDARGAEVERKPADARKGAVVKWKSCGSGVVHTPVAISTHVRRYTVRQYNNLLHGVQGEVRLIKAK